MGDFTELPLERVVTIETVFEVLDRALFPVLPLLGQEAFLGCLEADGDGKGFAERSLCKDASGLCASF
ncbi:hypothetical protein JJE66_33895 [Bradyrhizobium diazoefficiens]|uniref:hypothetical protein n=1 Tax=Bradyrhizobium diazoefficiens TaxID=1355477 RepID=UPI00190D13E1|nr:hypothetical protein [Bradyrhizobium diazoefficiens]MBK3666201.1 hypothetical protein [Bradyrhizobium diazoefficiens]